MNIEELAFKDRRTLAQLNGLDLLDIIELLQKDRKQWIYQFTNIFNESIKINETALGLYEENQELNKKYVNAVADYETTTAEKNELKEQLQNIRSEFLKYNWETATQDQICNQLKSLYESIFKEG